MDDVKFYYTSKNERQLSFDGHDFVVSVVDGDVHIVYQDSILCGKARQKGKLDSGRFATTSVRRPGGGHVCERCEELYKANGRLDWNRWVKNVSEIQSETG